MSLQKLFQTKLTTSLVRHSVRKCSQYAENYRVMGQPFPGKWSFDRFPWLREMCDSEAPLNVSQKSAQAGNSEVLLNRSFYSLDIKGLSVLYVLPSMRPDAQNFSASRFGPALEMSPYLARLFSDVNNVGLKRAGSASLIIAGSRSRSGLKSNPVGVIILDELDEMTQDNIPLALARTAGQTEKLVWMVSTPTIEGEGINAYHTGTTQEHFFFRCPSCTRYTELTFPDCLVIYGDDPSDPVVKKSHLRCSLCKNELKHLEKEYWLKDSLWVPTFKDRNDRGFHINQMYSSTVEPWEIAEHALKAVTNGAEEQELYNSRLGLTRTVAGTSVSEADIISCTKDHINGEQLSNRNGLITLGIDVGKRLHYVFVLWRKNKKAEAITAFGNDIEDISNRYRPKIIEFGAVDQIEQLYPLMDLWRPDSFVIDAQPERRLSFQFCMKYRGRGRMNWYVEGLNGRMFSQRTPDEEEIIDEEPIVSVDRTSWFDLTLGRFKHKGIDLPSNLSNEFKQHIKALTRVAKRDRHGNFVYHYKHKKNVDDHFAHALNYAEIALPFAASRGGSETIDIDFL